MKLIIKKATLLIMVFSLTLMSTANATAELKEMDGSSAKFSHIKRFSIDFDLDSSGTVSAYGSIIKYRGDYCEVRVEIQEYIPGYGWHMVSTRTASHKLAAAAGMTYDAVKGMKYREVAYGTVYEGDVPVETITRYSIEKTY